jgi:hypothetical protein
MKTIYLLLMLIISASGFSNPPESIARILKSGDGKSHQTAYEVYTIEEEYQLLAYLKLNPIIQMLCIKEGEYFDILQVEKSLIWFKLISQMPLQTS